MITPLEGSTREQTLERLYELLELQRDIEKQFGDSNYNIFVFGSYLTTRYVEGRSDIDIAVYAEDFTVYKRLSLFLEEYFRYKGIPSDIFFIDITLAAPIYCAPLNAQVQFTDYYPEKLSKFELLCRKKLEEVRKRIAV